MLATLGTNSPIRSAHDSLLKIWSVDIINLDKRSFHCSAVYVDTRCDLEHKVDIYSPIGLSSIRVTLNVENKDADIGTVSALDRLVTVKLTLTANGFLSLANAKLDVPRSILRDVIIPNLICCTPRSKHEHMNGDVYDDRPVPYGSSPAINISNGMYMFCNWLIGLLYGDINVIE